MERSGPILTGDCGSQESGIEMKESHSFSIYTRPMQT
jgi:hypothetical protein